jgi:hypothetical protein
MKNKNPNIFLKLRARPISMAYSQAMSFGDKLNRLFIKTIGLFTFSKAYILLVWVPPPQC